MKRVPRLAGALAAVAVLASALAGCGSSGASAKPSDLNGNNGTGPYRGVGLNPPQPRPNFTLTDTSGAAFSFGQRTSGHPTLLFFGYTNCPDVCPTTMADINRALTTIPAATQKQTYVVFVSTDVKRDTGPVIAAWLKNFQPGVAATFVGLHGSQTQLEAAETAAHIPLAEDEGQTHAANVLLYGPDDYARVTFLQGEKESEQIAHDLAMVVKQ